MKRPSLLAAFATALAALPAAPADIVLTPASGGGVAVTNAVGDSNRFRVGEDGLVTLGGNLDLAFTTAADVGVISKANSSFLHNYGANNTFLGVQSGNFTMTGVGNSAMGESTLRLNTSGSFNTANGYLALGKNTEGGWNTGVGVNALANNTTGSYNTAIGRQALLYNLDASFNVGVGSGALRNNVTGTGNTALGYAALEGNSYENKTGYDNAGVGAQALWAITEGFENAALGRSALYANSLGAGNTGVGFKALAANTTSFNSTGVGAQALANSTAAANIALGAFAGYNLTTGGNNIAIGHGGVAAEADTIRIGASQSRAFLAGVRGVTTGVNNAIPVFVDGNGQLGTASSSRRVKDGIADMAEASEALYRLRPVTFVYKQHAASGQASRQYGLVAEEVAEVAPELVVRSADGSVETVSYHFLAPMLLNEVQKQRQRIAALEEELSAIKQAIGLR